MTAEFKIIFITLKQLFVDYKFSKGSLGFNSMYNR